MSVKNLSPFRFFRSSSIGDARDIICFAFNVIAAERCFILSSSK